MSKNIIITIVSVVVLLILGLSSVFIVQQGEFKVVLKFGEAVRTELEPGIKLKIPFIEKVTSYPKKQMVYDSKSTSILTLDKKPILVDNYTIWRIVDPQLFIKTAVTVENAQLLIENAVYSTVRRKLSEIEYGQIISESTARGNLNQDITTDVAGLMLSNYGVEISDIRIKRNDLPEENKASVFNRIISDRQAIAASNLSQGNKKSRKITSNADSQAVELLAEAEANSKTIIAKAEQEAAKTYNTPYGKDPKFYNLYRTLDTYITSFQNEPVIMFPIDSP